MTLSVKFWGVRGSIACPSPKHMVYGGNTSCLEIIAGDNHLIFDAGTGIRNLGLQLLKDREKASHLFLTHCHWDHINGFPFFGPAYVGGNDLVVSAGNVKDKGGIENVLSTHVNTPTFPIPIDAMQAKFDFQDFNFGDEWDVLPGVKIITKSLNHPNGATGYRVEYGGKSICYVTDTEHVVGQPDQNVLDLIEGSEIVIYDSTFTDEEFPSFLGWGHSTWQEGVRLCKAANAKRLAIFHHAPEHDDDFMRNVADEARQEWNSCIVAQEQMVLTAT